MNKNFTIIKIGGSILTYKDKTGIPAFRRKIVRGLALEFAAYLKSSKENFILVHGAGSFGHPLAQKYNLAELNNIRNKNKIGACITHCSVQRLSLLTAEVFLRRECPVFCLSPAAFITQKKGRITALNEKPLKLLLKQRLIPLLHGDVVSDEKSGFSICSGDQIVSYLSNAFRSRRALFLSDVKAVMTDDPKIDPRAALLREIPRIRLSGLIRRLKQKMGADATGSMKGKLLEIAKMKCPVRIFNGLKKGNFLRALEDKDVGTKIF